MKINKAGIDLIKRFEGFVPNAYLCPAGVWTIGYGTTSAAGLVDVRKGMTITQEQADEWLVYALDKYEGSVLRHLKRTPNENQFSAMVSLCYNIGEGNFKGSTVLREFNDGNFIAAASAFRMWNKAAGKILPGLIRRREVEAQLFSKPVAKGEPPVLADYETPTEKDTSMFDVKSIFASKTLWGILISVVPTILQGAGITADQATGAVTDVQAIINHVMQLLGVVLAVWGRFTATKALTVTGK